MKNFPAGPGLGTLLRHLVELLDGDVEAIYREHALDCRSRFTPVIRSIDEHGPSSIRKLSSLSGVSHSAISQTVSEMLKKDLVVSVAGEDARERIVSLSPKLEAMLPKLKELWLAIGDASEEIDVTLRGRLAKAIEAVEHKSLRDRVRDRLGQSGFVTPANNKLTKRASRHTL